MKKLIEYFVNQSTFVNLLTLFVLLVGGYSAYKIKRETFPNVSFDIVTVTAKFPGAAPESVERLLTNPLEQDLKEVDGIKKMTSVSTDSQSVIALWLDPNQGDAKEIESDIQDVVDNFSDIPEGADAPIVTMLESKTTPIVEVSLSGDVDEETLRKTAKILERKIEALPSVAKIKFNGLRDYEIRVEADLAKLARFQVSIQDIIRALKARNTSIPGGIIEAGADRDKDILVRTMGEFETATDVENTVIRSNALAESILIKDVAKVSTQFQRWRVKMRTDGQPSITLTVLKKEKADAISLVDELRAMIASERENMDSRIEIDYVNDFSKIVKRRLSVLSGNLVIGLCIIIVVLGTLLPIRVAMVVATGIPFSFLGTMVFFYGMDVSLNLISMMGLIIVVGMLIDDAVVVVENCHKRTETGEDPKTAAVEGTYAVWLPVASSVMTTVAAFLPLMFMSGIFGKFVRQIPIGVVTALAVSLIQAYFVLPNHFAKLMSIRPSKKPLRGLLSGVFETLVEIPYAWLIGIVVKWRWIALLLISGIAGVTAVAAKRFSSFVLFPKGGIDIFMINVESEVGVPLKKMEEMMLPMEKHIATLPKSEVANFVTRVGMQTQDENRSKSGAHFGQILLYLTPEVSRARIAAEIIDELREAVGTPAGITKITYDTMAGGPPVGKPVSIGIRGDEYAKILPVVAQVKSELSQVKGVSDIEDNYLLGRKELQVSVRHGEAAAAGLTVGDVGTAVRAAFEGIVATSIRKLEEEVDIRVMFPAADRERKEALDQLMITNQRGQLIPLKRITTQDTAQGLAAYEHEANQRQVRVTAEVDESVTSSLEVNQLMQAKVAALAKSFPDIEFAFGGEDEDTKESMKTLMVAFVFAFVGIFFLLILTFGNVVQPILVSLTIPMGVIAVIWTFIIHDRPLSFLAIMGVIALGGVIVNNAILLIHTINKYRAAGLDRFVSIQAAAKNRIRPIFLTSLTTIGGVLPTAYGVGGLDPFVVPMALALGWGLAFGSVLTVVFFPAIIVVADDIIHAIKFVFRRAFLR